MGALANHYGPMTPLTSSIIRRALLSLTVLSLTSCGLLIEGVIITINRARELPEGKVLAGEGFILRCPGEFLRANRGEPTAGGITLRTEGSDRLYFVTPFKTSSARTTEQALAEWNQRPQMHHRQVTIMRQTRTMFAGLPATRAIIDFPHPNQGSIAVLLVVKRSNDFLILATGGSYYLEHSKEAMLAALEENMVKLQRNLTLTRK